MQSEQYSRLCKWQQNKKKRNMSKAHNLAQSKDNALKALCEKKDRKQSQLFSQEISHSAGKCYTKK